MYSRRLLCCRSIWESLTQKTYNEGWYGVYSNNLKRLKHDQYKGVKGIRNKTNYYEHSLETKMQSEGESEQSYNLDDSEYELVANKTMHVSRDFSTQRTVLIIQPYIKWGPQRNMSFSLDEQVNEAEALIRSLPNWSIALSIKVPLESLERKTLFGKGKLEELKKLVNELQTHPINNHKPLNCIFISKATLNFTQKSLLENTFNMPVMDRYSIVIQILRLYATSAEARLQVAMAELPYIWIQAKDATVSKFNRVCYTLTDVQKEVLGMREHKLKQELKRIRMHRKLLRQKRKKQNYPVVAVVGYTNAGKTSLIKALTQEQKMQPKNRLFATLDVTAHGGFLPCNLEVLYIDTVGFISNIPTGIIECFIATLEDALLADVILHVQDVSHSCYKAQREHVENTLESLFQRINDKCNKEELTHVPPIINVANKIDLLQHNQHQQNYSPDLWSVSSKTFLGIPELLEEIERNIFRVTGRRKITIKVRNGGIEMAWLYKNAAVVQMRPHENDIDYMFVDVVITDIVLQQFKIQFCQ